MADTYTAGYVAALIVLFLRVSEDGQVSNDFVGQLNAIRRMAEVEKARDPKSDFYKALLAVCNFCDGIDTKGTSGLTPAQLSERNLNFLHAAHVGIMNVLNELDLVTDWGSCLYLSKDFATVVGRMQDKN